MTEQEMNNALNAVGTLMEGEINIRKNRGSDDVLVTTKMHPFLALYLASEAVAELLWRAGEEEGDLQLDLSGGNARKILLGIANMTADEIEQMLGEGGDPDEQP